MTINNVKHFLSLIKTDSNDSNDSNLELLNYLLKQKIINRKDILRYCIISDYYTLLKKEKRKNCFDIKIDLANKYDVTFDFVCHTLYRNKKI